MIIRVRSIVPKQFIFCINTEAEEIGNLDFIVIVLHYKVITVVLSSLYLLEQQCSFHPEKQMNINQQFTALVQVGDFIILIISTDFSHTIFFYDTEIKIK